MWYNTRAAEKKVANTMKNPGIEGVKAELSVSAQAKEIRNGAASEKRSEKVF